MDTRINFDPFDAMARVLSACDGLSTRDTLDVLQLTWLAVASKARNEQLTRPRGFADEQARQVAHLRTLTDLVVADVPDEKMERLARDTAGIRQHLQTLLQRRGHVQ